MKYDVMNKIYRLAIICTCAGLAQLGSLHAAEIAQTPKSQFLIIDRDGTEKFSLECFKGSKCNCRYDPYKKKEVCGICQNGQCNEVE